MLDFILYIFFYLYFFSKEIIIFEDIIKEKKMFDVNSKKEHRVSCFTPNDHRMLKNLQVDES